MKSPPEGVPQVLDAVSLLLDGTTEWRKTFSRANLKNELDLFDVMEVNPAIIRRLREEYLKFGYFNPEVIHKKSGSASGLCHWVINTVKIYEQQQKINQLR